MNVSSIVIQARNEFIEGIVEKVKKSDFCDYHFHDASKGKVIVTVEGANIDEEMKKVRKIEAIEHVISAEMMMSYSEDELDAEREKLALSDVVPEILNDDNVKAEDIDYRGDLKRNYKGILMLTSYKTFIQTHVPSGELIVSRTDLKGIITYANETFAQISGYKVEELIGKHHNIVRHPDMPRSVFANLWKTIKSENLWKGYVKNLRKDGGFYWVYAEVSGVYKDGKLVEYKSMRSPVDEEVELLFQEKYDDMRAKEEGSIRVVATLSVENVEKLKKMASDKNENIDKVLDEILEDNLF